MCLLHREGFCYCWRRYDFKSLHHVKGYHRKKTTGLKRKPSHNSHIGCFIPIQFSSVQFSRSVMSNSLWPHEPQHARPPCPSPTPGVHPNPCPLKESNSALAASSYRQTGTWPFLPLCVLESLLHWGSPHAFRSANSLSVITPWWGPGNHFFQQRITGCTSPEC